jgi:uncharacterized protein YprB with RNaseH-like and TPR domain/predicted nuclease with RNAse H fold/dephospho-CoA kinase
MEQSMLPLHDFRNDGPQIVHGRVKTPARRSTCSGQWEFEPALADPANVIFLDVETTGLSWYYDELTLVGWAQGGNYHVHVAGEDPAFLLGSLAGAAALVTFNGTLFDLRFLKKSFCDLRLPPVHVDLRYLAKRAGLTGGQKAIEQILGLHERIGLEDVDGAAAVVLWHRYLRGDRKSLNRLIEYNRHDVLGMCRILDETLDRLEIHPDLLFRRPNFSEQATTIRKTPVPYKGHSSVQRVSPPSFHALFAGTRAEQATVVGIDLTGSESRPSGWCSLHGNVAQTRMVSTDDELLALILEERPSVVSIDSPLSIPFGRSRVDDGDPARDEYGIMRRCERELKRRGINVYPCLLPSMQGLTRRGMLLAQRIRSHGIPVIESYPGAAQDIMGIPRKGAGVEFLRSGLADFGISGSFAEESVTHDELDAITSAIVGSFFLSGRYEALRGPSEGALIIPDLKSAGQNGMVIGISGRICAGKTTAARLLESQGFSYTRFSLVIDDEIVARGQIPNRASRQQVGLDINHSKGQRWLCERALERVGEAKLIVVDGLRFPEDHAFFAERFGSRFIHLHIKASEQIRASRYKENEQDQRAFERADNEPVEAKIQELSTLADVVVVNESTIAEFTDKVLNIISALGKSQLSACPSRLS